MTGGNAVYIGKTNRAILSGDDDVSEWTDEELLRGQRKGRNGKWQGRRPKVVPMRVYDELVRRRLSEAGELLRENLVEATKVLISLATDPQVDPAVRLRASQLIMERVMGKTPEKVDIRLGRKTWEDAVEIMVVGEMEDVIEAAAIET